MPRLTRRNIDVYSGGERKPYRLKYGLGTFTGTSYLDVTHEDNDGHPSQTTVPSYLYMAGAERIIYVPFLQKYIVLYATHTGDLWGWAGGRQDYSWNKSSPDIGNGFSYYIPDNGAWRTYRDTVGIIHGSDLAAANTWDTTQSLSIKQYRKTYASMFESVTITFNPYTETISRTVYSMETNTPRNTFHDVVILDDRIVAATNRGPAISTNGTTWTFVDETKPIRSIIKSGSNLIALGNEDYHQDYNYTYTINTWSKYTISTDNGNTWSNFISFSFGQYEVAIWNIHSCGSVLLAYGGIVDTSKSTRVAQWSEDHSTTVGAPIWGVWLSYDNGANWNIINMSSIGQTSRVDALGRWFYQCNGNNIYGTFNDTGGGYVYSWSNAKWDSHCYFRNFVYNEEQNIIVGYMEKKWADDVAAGPLANTFPGDVIIYSTNNGATWTVDLYDSDNEYSKMWQDAVLNPASNSTKGYYNSRLNKYFKYNYIPNGYGIDLYINDTTYYTDSKIRKISNGARGDIGAAGIYTQYKGNNWSNWADNSNEAKAVGVYGNPIKIEGISEDKWLIRLQASTSTNEYLILY